MGRSVQQGRALLADRHLGMLGGAHALLEALFDTVLKVADERFLMEAVTTFRPDLIVVDLSPSREGEGDVARCLMQCDPASRIIVLSVHDEATVVGQMRGVGVAGFVLKRAAATALVPAVEEVLRGGVYVSAAVGQDRHEANRPPPTGTAGEPGTRFEPGVRSGPSPESGE